RLVLWRFQGVSDSGTRLINALIRSVLWQERGGNNSFTHEALTLRYKLDNQFELVFVVGFQKILTLTYAGKLIDAVHRLFCDKHRTEIQQQQESSKIRAPTTMKKLEDSEKAKKPVRSMIETRGEKPKEKAKNSKKKTKQGDQEGSKEVPAEKSGLPVGPENGIELSKQELIRRKGMEKSGKSSKSNAPKEKGKKVPGVWALGGSANREVLDYCTPTTNGAPEVAPAEGINLIRGTGATKGNVGGMFGMLRGLEGSKSLSREDMESVLDKMRDHLIAKNVAADIAVQLCESVANKLEGKVMGTFSTQALQESLVQILQPQHCVDMLQDIMDAQHHQRPYVVTFCGVNDMGKSINLAKISFWLLENGFSVLIPACDTFLPYTPPENHGSHTMVQLFEKGYGKDAAGITMEAVAFAHNQGFDVVLVDTAGRMQDNAPLMTALAKLITVNAPTWCCLWGRT
ncbi:hypothetical protein EI555_008883, partial [Monodon monoceros]